LETAVVINLVKIGHLQRINRPSFEESFGHFLLVNTIKKLMSTKR